MGQGAPFNQSRQEWTRWRLVCDRASKGKPWVRVHFRRVRADLHFYATVPMPDAGAGLPIPTDRRTTNEAVVETYDNLCHWAVLADELGYDTFWLTEHHLQHEGYEITPNLILFGLHLRPDLVDMSLAERSVPEEMAQRTRVRFGGDVPFGWSSADLAANGVIGDPTGAAAEEGEALARDMVASLGEALAEVAAFRFPGS